MKQWWTRFTGWIRASLSAIVRPWKVVLIFLIMLAGLGCVGWAMFDLLGSGWLKLYTGLVLLSFVGLKPLWVVVRDGLYDLLWGPE